MLTITHSAAEGTMLEGSVRGDGAWDAIKAAQATYRIRGWKYFPSIRAIGVRNSRDRAPQLSLIDATAAVLRDAGFEVDVQVDATPRAMEDAEADRAERMDDRAAALRAKAARKGAEAAGRHAAADAISDGIPMGQPILVGHHSERRHRRDLERMHNHTRKGIELGREAEQAAGRAESAERHMDVRQAPGVVARRIERLEADRRKVQRNLDGYTRNHRDHSGAIYHQEVSAPASGRYREQMEASAAELDEKIRYWKGVQAEQRESGTPAPPGPDSVKVGDWVGSWAGWREVVRVNKVSVTVWDDYGNGPESRFKRTIRFSDIRQVRQARPV
jgi:hypothetical protein